MMKPFHGLSESKRAARSLVCVAVLILAISPSPTQKTAAPNGSAGAVIKRGIAISGSQTPDSPKVVTPEKEAVLPPRTVDRRCAPDRDAPCPVTLIELQ